MRMLRSYMGPLAVMAYLFSFLMVPAAHAEMLGTRTMLDSQARQAKVEHVREMLSQDRVEQQMIALGVDPADAKTRVASLTDAQLAQVEGKLETLPAGGDGVLVVLGIVFVVLLVLELVGVTDIFNRI